VQRVATHNVPAQARAAPSAEILGTRAPIGNFGMATTQKPAANRIGWGLLAELRESEWVRCPGHRTQSDHAGEDLSRVRKPSQNQLERLMNNAIVKRARALAHRQDNGSPTPIVSFIRTLRFRNLHGRAGTAKRKKNSN